MDKFSGNGSMFSLFEDFSPLYFIAAGLKLCLDQDSVIIPWMNGCILKSPRELCHGAIKGVNTLATEDTHTPVIPTFLKKIISLNVIYLFQELY